MNNLKLGGGSWVCEKCNRTIQGSCINHDCGFSVFDMIKPNRSELIETYSEDIKKGLIKTGICINMEDADVIFKQMPFNLEPNLETALKYFDNGLWVAINGMSEKCIDKYSDGYSDGMDHMKSELTDINVPHEKCIDINRWR